MGDAMLSSMVGFFMGVQIIVRAYPRVEVPRHRKQRLAKKWRKRYGPKYRYLPVNEQEILHDPHHDILYCYPRMADQLRRMVSAAP